MPLVEGKLSFSGPSFPNCKIYKLECADSVWQKGFNQLNKSFTKSGMERSLEKEKIDLFSLTYAIHIVE